MMGIDVDFVLHSMAMAAHRCMPTWCWLLPKMPSLRVASVFTLPPVVCGPEAQAFERKRNPVTHDDDACLAFCCFCLLYSQSPNYPVGTVQLGTGLAIMIITE